MIKKPSFITLPTSILNQRLSATDMMIYGVFYSSMLEYNSSDVQELSEILQVSEKQVMRSLKKLQGLNLLPKPND